VLRRPAALAALRLQGSLLSIGIVFMNMGLSTLKDYVRAGIRRAPSVPWPALPATHQTRQSPP
jgi:hypothetical protein